MGIPLYALASEYLETLYTLSENDAPEEAIQLALDGLQKPIEEKAANVAAYFLNLESEAAAVKEAEKRMKRRRETLERSAQRLRGYLQMNMERLNIPEIKTAEFLVRLRANPPKVIIDNDAAVPKEYKVPVISERIDKIFIKEVIQGGSHVPGTRLEQANRLEIR